MKVGFQLKGNGLDAMANLLEDYPKKLPREVAGIANKVAKAHTKAISKQVRNRIAITNKEALKSVPVTKKATATDIDARLMVKKTFRPSLKAFKARQTKQGVSYKISKQEGVKKIKSAFILPQLGGHVFKRKGNKRFPIQKLRGPSVWGVYVKNELIQWSVEELSDEFGKQVARRQRAIIVNAIKKQGRAKGLSTEQINQQIQNRFA
jgi:hypothetical protein